MTTTLVTIAQLEENHLNASLRIILQGRMPADDPALILKKNAYSSETRAVQIHQH